MINPTHSPLVSVVIPFVNHREFLHPAVAKLRMQTYSNWEAILVDNNSTDGSSKIALSLEAEYPGQVRYVSQPTQGIPFARNKGLAEARGKYITFLDVDDEFIPTKLADHVRILERQPDVAMTYGMTRRVYRPSGRVVIQDVGAAREGVNEPPTLGIDWIRSFFRLPQTGATLVRTTVAREVGGFSEQLQLGNDDIAFHIKLGLNYRIWFVPREAVIYYRHSFSEGARLNRLQSATARYLDAHGEWVMPYTAEYERRTGDQRPRLWAERALVRNLAYYAAHTASTSGRSRREVLRELANEQRARGYLRSTRQSVFLMLCGLLPIRIVTAMDRRIDRLLPDRLATSADVLGFDRQ